MSNNIPKQRGIFSEILTTEDSENLKLISTIGPSAQNVVTSNIKQKVPRALGIKRRDELIKAGLDQFDPKGKILGKSYYRNPDVNKGYYSKKRDGVADVDPKVMEPYVPIPGKPPRKVVIDRQRKLFASLDIEELLLEFGINYREPQPTSAEWLPLEPFDDNEYDCRTPDEWINLGYNDQDEFIPIPGKGLFKDTEGQGTWRRVLIFKYNHEKAIYDGEWDGSEEQAQLTRINILFDAEDPRIFAERVAKAHQERLYADSLIRYNYFIDNMPIQELPELDSEQTNRITLMVTNNKTLRGKTPNTTEIFTEVNLDFARTMNRIIFDYQSENQNEEDKKDMLKGNLTLPQKESERDAPYFGMVPIPQHDFPEQFSNFCFNSLYIKEEVITAMVEIKMDCNNLMKNDRVFDTKQDGVPYRLEEFKQKQNSSISQIKFKTGTDVWIGKLERTIRNSFNDVGKGWFNIRENSKETYEFGKLKKFLTVVNFMMQDTVLSMCKDSVKEFVEFIVKFIPDQTIITATGKVQNIFPGQEEDSESDDDLKVTKDPPPPLFVLDLVLKPNQLIPQYSTDPNEIVKQVLNIFDDGIKVLQEIPQLEPILLKDLFKTGVKKNIKAPIRPHDKPIMPHPANKKVLPDENTWLWDAYEVIRDNLQKAILPLSDYLQTFQSFEEENKLNPDKFIKELDDIDNPASVEEIKADIENHQKEEDRLLSEICETINVSIFRINCKDIRNLYSGKHSSIVEKEIKLIAQRAREKNYEVSTKFEDFEARIRKPPKNIEELTAVKEYMAAIPLEVEKERANIQSCMDIYGILEGFNFEFNVSELDQKWHMFGAPTRLMEIIEKQKVVLEKEKEQFLKKMEEEQEEFEETLDNLALTVGGFNIYDDITKYDEIAFNVESVNQRLKDCLEQSKLFNSREFLTGKDQKDYTRLNQMVKDFQPYSNMWLTTKKWFISHESWLKDPWEDLDAIDLENTVENAVKTIGQVLRYFKDKELPQILKIATEMKANIDKFKPYVPLAVSLRKEGMYERHWDQISDKVGFDIRPTEDFTLTTVIDKGLLAHLEVCEEVGERAAKEYNIECQLSKMSNDWKDSQFVLPQFKTTTTNTIGGFDDAITMLDEHIVTTQAMQFSPFKKPFEAEIEEWNRKMLLVSDTLEEWVKCQGQWMYLQPIFDSPDIVKQLPQESKRFKSVDSTWRHIINQTKQAPHILGTCSKEGLLEKFQEANKNLEIVQKGLADYLEKKRSIFARFYFLSNDELLEILSQTKEVRNVRPHLRKVFENMADLEFKEDDSIVAMMSGEGEKINYVKKIDPKDRNVEYWMGDVEKMMQISVRDVLLKSIEDYTCRPRTEWVLNHAGQCVLNGSQVHWTKEVEEAFKLGTEGISKYRDFLQEQLDQSVELVRQKLTKNETITLNALIVIDVHARDVIGTLRDENVVDINAFEWISQVRYYWEEDDCWCKCVQTVFPYGYEYLGNTLRLVITPLTDKCYMTLMGALRLNLGGAPAGPAGTGKTESTKDLAKAMAKQCVVFNCSGDMDHLMVAKFFKGLTSAGAWCCFDEFNRINIEVLSVIAQQLLVLFKAKANGDSEIEFENSLIKIKPTFCVFITMNPGYAGRTELPDNLKALFRPVAMMVPDYALIGEIMLYSFGFNQGKDLARKMVTTFKLSSEQLSSQDHYDYGMRAVRSVINAAGLLKPQFPDMDEDRLLLRALRDVNVPKFLKDDLPLFQNIILEIFPGTKRPEVDYGNLHQSILDTCVDRGLQSIQSFIDKIYQLYDTIQVRHGLMIVGPTGGGKTSNYVVLAEAISRLKGQEGFEKTIIDILNPKSITMGQLYGYSDPQTTEWVDGVLAKLVSDASRDATPDSHWIMFDGPVDALWIENMNTVLDDNKKLCLNSGQIITLTARMTMMFEVEDLSVASPATVSRCGMIYMEPQSLTLRPLVDSWLLSLPIKVKEKQSIANQLSILFEKFIDSNCYFLRKHLIEPVDTVDNNLCQSLQRIIDCYLANYVEDEIKKVQQEDIDHLDSVIQNVFLYALIWSTCVTSTYDGRKKFDAFMRGKFKEHSIDFPEEGLIFDYCFSIEKNEWIKWLDTAPEYNVDLKLAYNEIVVPTPDSIRMKYIIKLLLTHKKHVLTPGPTGTGKSVNISDLLTYELPEEFQTLAMTFSAQTSENQTQDYLDDKFEKRRKGVYGPSVGKKFIIFIDDMNMPKKEEFGAQPPLELLRQWMDHFGWYDRKSKEKPFMRIEDIIFVSAMGPPGGGRSAITQRLQRHFNIITYTDLPTSDVRHIFLTIMKAFFASFQESVRNIVDDTVDMTMRLYDSILTGPLKPIPSKSHYTFNLRDTSKVFQGVCSAFNKSVMAPVHLIRLWIHECKRVFGDRLIDNIDRTWLHNQLVSESEKTFDLKSEEIFNSERLIFGDYMLGLEVDPRIYCQIENLKDFVTKIEEFLEDYNQGQKNPMKLVMFVDACDHVSRISRILRNPLGNALLLGVGGSGRQSLSRLATFIATYKIFQIEVIKGYGMQNWREDVKRVLLQCGVENKSTTFLFCDTQIVNEQMLEDINNILNSGDVPSLYKTEDFEPIFTIGKAECMSKNLAVTKMNMFSQYLGRVKKNIHFIIAMSPLGELFRTRLRKFPSLVNCCTLDWFSEWPEEALVGVAYGALTENDLELKDFTASCVEMMKIMHQTVEEKSIKFLNELRRTNYVTPTSYLELLSSYKNILQGKRNEIMFAKNRLVKGLEVLAQAAIEVEKLETMLVSKQPELEETKRDVETTKKRLGLEVAAADEERKIVAADEAEATQQEAEANALMDEAQTELGKAKPLLEEAVRVLNSLKVDDFYVLSSINNPTPTVVLGMELSCIMMGLKPKKNLPKKAPNDTHGYFDCAKGNLLNEPKKFMQKMVDFDKNNISESTVKKVNNVLSSPDFTLEKVKSASNALVAIYKWVDAMMKFHQLLKIVKPKQAKVDEMREKLKVVRASLAEKRKRLKEVDELIENLERQYSEKVQLENSLLQQIEECNKKLERAGKLINGLEGEKTRWTATVQSYTEEYELLIGNCLIAAGMVAYAGPFISQYRTELEHLWRDKIKELGIDFQEDTSMIKLLEDKVTTKQWTAASLPNDTLSIENGIIMFKSRRWPLMIDPQTQANKFIKNLGKEEAEGGLDIFKLSDGNLLRNMELAIQFGKWVLLENVGQELDPAFEPILLQQKIKTGSGYSLRLGDKTIQYNENFRFFMTTTIPNPHYSPETSVKVTILNFAITPFGLEEQMLNQFVLQEMPDLQKKKDSIVQQNAQSAKILRDIEDKILEGLVKNDDIAQILEDDDLINILQDSKKTSDEINQRLIESEITEKEIDKTRESFRPVAFRASVLFFCIVDLAGVDPMYQYSLQWFSQLFGSSIDNSPKSNDVSQRIKNLNDHFTLNLYENVCRSLFERHKIQFSFILTIKILQGEGKIDNNEWRFLLAGPSGEFDKEKNPTDWLDDLEWLEVCKNLQGMESLPIFKGIKDYFIMNHKDFQKIFDSTTPQDEKCPGEWDTKLNSFQKLILLKVIRLDKVIEAVQNYICEMVGRDFIIPPTFDLAKSFKDSSVTTPLIFVLSQGSDPVADFMKFAEEMNMTKKLDSISLGRGQENKAVRLIEDSQQRGGWALLMNCHLSGSFMPRLEQVVENMDDSNHRDFRLWLTSMPSPTFPVSTLQNSVKMTLEPPKGLRANLLRSYAMLDNKELNDCVNVDQFKKLLFGFCFFHAIIQDRRKFGPIGWNIAYEFTNEDLMVCRKQLKTFVDEYAEVPYKVLNYLGADINYGGRVTDDKDIRLIKSILSTYIRPEILEDGFPFSPSGKYYSPPVGEQEDYIDYIKTLDINPNPEVFCLHENAEIITLQNDMRGMLETIMGMQPRTSSGVGLTREQVIGDISKRIQAKTPPPFDLELVGSKYPTQYSESMNTVLFQECVRYNRLLVVMAETLKNIQKAIVGEVVMSEELEKMSSSLFDNIVPGVWADKGFLSLKPLGSWTEDMLKRIDFLTQWIDNGTPKVFWFSGFFFPQAFLTGSLQNFARKYIIAIDQLDFEYRILDDTLWQDITEKPDDGVYLYGMYLEGARWDSTDHLLGESLPKQLYTELPLLLMVPIQNKDLKLAGIYNTPVYKVLSRAGTLSTTGHSTNFVMMMELKSKDPENTWVRAGVAAFLSLRY